MNLQQLWPLIHWSLMDIYPQIHLKQAYYLRYLVMWLQLPQSLQQQSSRLVHIRLMAQQEKLRLHLDSESLYLRGFHRRPLFLELDKGLLKTIEFTL
ncbi:MAG: hypothetical protein C4537_04875 [Acholeplasma sp.]|nr:MAG: hypothetical protein C4537_04875 [Acholeplasma sp.]